jgi:hypothetical protein
MRECRKFAVDLMSYHDDMKLEWFALGQMVDRLVRTPLDAKKEKEDKDEDETDADSDKEDDDDPELKIEACDMKFQDIYGVKIFEKEIRAGKL